MWQQFRKLYYVNQVLHKLYRTFSQLQKIKIILAWCAIYLLAPSPHIWQAATNCSEYARCREKVPGIRGFLRTPNHSSDQHIAIFNSILGRGTEERLRFLLCIVVQHSFVYFFLVLKCICTVLFVVKHNLITLDSMLCNKIE